MNTKFMRYNIGNTELKLVKGLLTTPTAVFAKLEYENPTGSHKDRMYLAMIEELERRKKIRKGMTLVDYSSGNGGASLAYIAGKRGYKAFVVVPSQMSKEKIDQIKKLGGEVKTIHSNANYGFYAPDDMLKARIEAARIGQSDRSRFVFLDQGENPMNAKAFESLGKEIVNGLKMKQVKPDAFVCGIGTGGTLTGVGRVLRKTYRDKIKVFGVEPHESRTIFAALHKQKAHHVSHDIAGIGMGTRMANVAVGLMDDVILVKRTEWVQMMKKAHERGYPIGKSSAANLAAIEKVAKRFPQFKNIVTVFFDGKEKYASEFNLDAKADSHAKVDIRSAEQHAGAAWDELYRDAGFQLHTDTARLIKDIIPVLKKKQVKKILSVPCGDFINEAYLGKSGFAVDGIDAAPTAIRKSKERIKNQSILRCTARFGDIFKMKLRKRDYDAVIVHDLTMHLSNETCVTLLSKLSEVLKPDGLLIINFHSQLDETLKYGSLVAAYVRSVRDNKILIYYRSQHEIEHIFSASPFSIQKLFLYNRVDVHHNKFRVEEKKTHTHRPYCVIAEKRFSSVSEVVVDVKKGKPIIVVDNREQEGDLYVASEKVRPQTINEMLSVGRGVLCVSLLPQRFHELDLRSPDDWGVGYNDSRFGDPVDYLIGTTTGVSAYDRAATIRALTQAATRRSDLLVPGHVRTTESMKNGLKEREGHSEACVELSRIAGLYPSGTQIEIVGRNGKMADERGLFEIAAQKGYKMIQINQIKHYLYGVV